MLYHRLGVLVLSTILAAGIVVMATRHKDGFQNTPSSGSYVLPAPASKEVTQANFWSIVSIQQSVGRVNTFSKKDKAGSTPASTMLKLISLVSTPKPSDKLQLTFSNYISIYALAKYNYDAVAARYALMNNFDAIQDELVANVSDQTAKTNFSRDPKQNSCNQLNTVAMSLYAKTQGLEGKMVDLSGTEITAGKLHDENLSLQKSVGSACGNSAACIQLASQDATVFPLLYEYDSANESLVEDGAKVQGALSTVLQAYRAIQCSLPVVPGTPSIETVFSDSYISNLGFVNTQRLSDKLQELSSYYVPPETIKYISKQLIAGDHYKTKLETAEDYSLDMSKTMNNIVSMTTTLPGGMFYDEKGSGGFRTCPAGFVCSQTAAVPTACPAGYYCPTGTLEKPIPCPPKTYSPPSSFAPSSCTSTIPAGYFLKPVESFTTKRVEGFATTELAPCPAGTYCPPNSSTAIPCPIGTYNPTTSATECKPAPAGTYVDKTGETKFSACEKGTYNPTTGGTSSRACIPCPVSTYCPSNGMTMYNTCPLGTFSVTRGATSSSVCNPCAAGTYSTELITSQSQCLPCPVGSYCSGGISMECPAGTYCPQGAGSPTPCPAGVYGSDTGLSTAACNGPCQAGFYCNSGAKSPTQQPCQEGYYCPTGTYSSCPSSTSSCPTGAGAQLQQLCRPGTYCPTGSSSETKCPAGTYNSNSGATSSSACISCPVGHYCPEGSRQPIACIAGTYNIYQNATTKNTCQYCRAGTFSKSGASYCFICEEGDYCPGPVSGNEGVIDERYIQGDGGEIICPVGTYSLNTGETDVLACLTCPAGSYCPNSKTRTSCPAGTYSNTRAATSPSTCLPCSANTFSNPGATFCSTCPPGSYCPNTSTKLDCPENTYSTTNGATSPSTCLSCPTGTYSPTASSHCIYCPSGTFGNSYSGSGSGSSTASSNLKNRCSTCIPGSFCPGLADNLFYTGTYQLTGINGINVCPAGTFSPAGSGSCQYCPAGKSSKAGSASCLSCEAGEYCPGPPPNALKYSGSTSPAPQGDGGEFICPPGSYCPTGNVTPIQCSIGEYCPIGSPDNTRKCPPAFAPGQPCCPIGTYYDYTPSFVPEFFMANNTCAYTKVPLTFAEARECPKSFYPTSFCGRTYYTSQLSTARQFPNFSDQMSSYQAYSCMNWTPNPALFSYTGGSSGSGSTYTIRTRTDNFKCNLCPTGTYGYSYLETRTTGVSQSDPLGNGCRTLGTASSNLRLYTSLECTILGGTWQPSSICIKPDGKDSDPTTWFSTQCAPLNTINLANFSTLPITFPKIDSLLQANSIAKGIQPVSIYAYGKQGSVADSLVSSPVAFLNNTISNIAPWGAVVKGPISGISNFPFYYEGDVVSYQGQHYICIQPAINNEPPTDTNKWQNLDYVPVCLGCPAGTFNSVMGVTSISACIQCPAGTYSSSNSPACTYCPAGTWSTAGSTSCQSASLIPPGYYYPGVSSTSLYTGKSNLAEIKQCPGGTFSTGGTGGCKYCPAGQSSEPGSSSCLPCDWGEYCPGPPSSVGSSLYTGSTSGSIAGINGEYVCPAGSYCLYSSSTPTPCPAGTHNPNTNSGSSSACLPCSTGQYSTPGSPLCSTCAAGQYCTTPATTAICPTGSYCPPGTVTPIKCNPGQYNSLQGKTSETACLYCSAQTYSASGAATCSTCSAGSYSSAGASTCMPCPAGSYCGTCPYGANYCTVTDPLGNGCKLLGTADPDTSMNLRTYTATDCAALGGTTFPESICIPPGSSTTNPNRWLNTLGTDPLQNGCLRLGRTHPTLRLYTLEECNILGGDFLESGICLKPGGTDSDPTTWFSTACAPLNTKCLTLGRPAGQNNSLRLYSQAECNTLGGSHHSSDVCLKPGGNYSDPTTWISTDCAYLNRPLTGDFVKYNATECTALGGVIASPTLCLKSSSDTIASYITSASLWFNTQCSALNSPITYAALPAFPKTCPAGTYSLAGQQYCTDCPIGSYCPTPGSPSAQTCPAGTYSAAAATGCIYCPAGQYSSPGQGSCINCPIGAYCPGPPAQAGNALYTGSTSPSVAGSGGKLSCTPGTYSPGPGWAQCMACPVGQYCPIFECSAAVRCNPGYTSRSGVVGGCGICTAAELNAGGCKNPGRASCPPGTFSNGGATACSYCPSGMTSLGWNSAICTACPGGSYCPGVTDSGTVGTGSSLPSSSVYFYTGVSSIVPPIEKCPVGSYCPEGSSQPIKCSAGSYNTAIGQSICTPCSGGTYNTSPGLNSCLTCSEGKYSPPGSTSCTSCEAGTYSSSGSASCTGCPVGRYSAAVGANSASTCTACPAGTVSVLNLGSPYCVYCPPGKYSIAGQGPSGCRQCSAGDYCPGPPTDAGSIYDGNTYAVNPQGVGGEIICPKGYSCTAGLSEPTICPAGSFSPSGAISCTQCSTGYFSNTPGASICEICPGGTVSSKLSGSPHCNYCPAGTYSSISGGINSCIPCTAGNYCPGIPATSGSSIYVGSTSTLPPGTNGQVRCPVGSYCPAGTITPVACPPGYYGIGSGGAADQTAGCQTCTAGTYSASLGANSPSTCLLCPAGTFSTPGSTSCRYCPSGTGNTSSGSPSCSICSAGQYCPGPPLSGNIYTGGVGSSPPPPTSNFGSGSLRAGQIYPCPPGTASSSNSSSCTACEPGTFQQYSAQGSCSKCPTGTYNSVFGASSSSACIPAPPGNFALAGASTYTPCAPGKYADTAGQGGCLSCGRGTFSLEGASSCQICPAGTYQNAEAATSCIYCPPRKYSNAGANACSDCQPGQYCPGPPSGAGSFYDGSSMNLSPQGSGGQVICPPGTFCPSGGSSPQQCDIGRYCPISGLSIGSACPPGQQCSAPGGITPSEECPAGYYCPAGTGSSPTPCAAGTFNSLTGQTSVAACLPCGPGTASKAGSITCAAQTAADPGYYLPANSNTYVSCPAGTYNSSPGGTKLSDCIPCAAGSYSTNTAATSQSTCLPCPAGSYCGTGARTFTKCPPGTFSTSSANTSIKACISVPGYYTQISGMTNPTRCQPGFACAGPGGTVYLTSSTTVYSTSTAAAAATGTSASTLSMNINDSCPAGYYCPDGAHPIRCPAGSYCPNGSSKPIQCPAKTYNPTAGSPDSITGLNTSVCIPCPANTSSLPGSASCSATCPPGAYCSGTNATATACPAGTFISNTNGTSSSSCSACSTGSYCPPASTSNTPCPLGSYCPTASTIIVCPAGTFGATTGLTSLSQCTTCPIGSYCINGLKYPCTGGYSSTTGNSSPGSCMVCPLGTYSSADNISCTYCPAGTSSPASSSSSSACIVCPPGQYCPGPPSTGDTYAGSVSTSLLPGIGPSFCPPGTYCPQGGSMPLQCPIGTYCPIQGMGSGSPCPPGQLCNAPGGISPSSGGCPPGTYSLGGAGSSCTPCPAGSWCTSTSITKCAVGSYCPPGSTSQAVCEAGSYCSIDTTSQTQCGPGTYSGPGQTTCSQCASGLYNLKSGSTTSADCLQCTAGSYCTTPATISICPAGFYCPAGTVNPIGCRPGTYSSGSGAPGSSTCIPCTANTTSGLGATSCSQQVSPPGFYFPANSPATVPCPAGTYLPSWGATNVSQCIQCEQGKFCPNPGSTVATLCPAGTFSSGIGAITCKTCPVGFNCATTGTITPTKCLPGFACTGGTNIHYTPSTLTIYGSAAAAAAAPGTTSSTNGTSNNQQCPGGYYCPDGTYPIRCPAGSWCPAGASVPSQCPPNTYGPNAGASSPPTPQLTGTSTCLICNPTTFTAPATFPPFSSFSPPGASSCSTSSPAGTYTPVNSSPALYGYNTGSLALKTQGVIYYINGAVPPWTTVTNFLTSSNNWTQSGWMAMTTFTIFVRSLCNSMGLEQCSAFNIDTTNNRYSIISRAQLATAVLTQTPTTTWSSSFLYSISPSSFTRIYSSGVFLNAPILCPAGTYNPNANSTSSSACIACAAGTYCPPGSTSSITCPMGSYCPPPASSGTGPAVQIALCPNGTFGATTGLTSASQCTVCPIGSYCINGTKITCDGGYTDGTGKSSPAACILCPTGTYSSPTNTTCLYCPAGQTSTPGSSSCIPCPPGQYCNPPPNSGTLIVGSGSGSYLSTLAPVPCPPGTFCGTGGSSPQQCLIGQYCPIRALGSGSPCPPGQLCNAPGGISPSGSCPPGTFSPGGAGSSCTPCPAGSYCLNPGARTVAGTCPAGTFSLAGATGCTYCPPGTTNTTSSSSSCNAMDTTAGFYYPGISSGSGSGSGTILYTGTTSPTLPKIACPIGSYCPKGASQPIRCAPGSYSTATNAAICTMCSAGTYGTDTGASLPATCKGCPAGTQSSAGAPGCTYCPAGTWSAANAATCTACVAGQYCPGPPTGTGGSILYTGSTSLSTQGIGGRFTCPAGYSCPTASGSSFTICPAGTYSPAGATTCTQCPAGKYSPNPGASSSATCLSCPTGQYSLPGSASCSTSCPAGAYCPNTTTTISCPAGTYNTLTGQTAATACTPCAAGNYSTRIGANSATTCLACTSGDYCPAGSANKNPCAAGYYCSSDTLTQTPCPAGSYCTLRTITPIPCTTGNYCPVGSSSQAPCAAGYYCSTDASTQTPCPYNTYSSATSATSASTCTSCPAVNPNSSLASTSITNCGKCPAGSVCPLAGANPGSPIKCGIGFYNPYANMFVGALTGCARCPYGSYSPTTGSVSCLPCVTIGPNAAVDVASKPDCTR